MLFILTLYVLDKVMIGCALKSFFFSKEADTLSTPKTFRVSSKRQQPSNHFSNFQRPWCVKGQNWIGQRKGNRHTRQVRGGHTHTQSVGRESKNETGREQGGQEMELKGKGVLL